MPIRRYSATGQESSDIGEMDGNDSRGESGAGGVSLDVSEGGRATLAELQPAMKHAVAIQSMLVSPDGCTEGDSLFGIGKKPIWENPTSDTALPTGKVVLVAWPNGRIEAPRPITFGIG
jgi:hypothetical protein